jgi:hypothetical protein
MFLALLVVLALAETYRRSRHRLRVARRAMPEAWRALQRDVAGARRRVATWEWAGLALVTVLAIVLRVRELSQPIRYDEAATWLDYASQPIARALSDYRFPNNHLFHTLLVHVSAAIFGSAPWALRLPAFVAGVAVVPLTWALARALHSRTAALGAAGLAATSATLVLYSTNARGYTMLACLTIVLALLATRVVRDDNVATWTMMAAVAALGAWTIPTMLYPAGGVGLWVWLEARAGEATLDARTMRSRLRWTGTAALAVTAVLYLPVVAGTGIALLVGNRFVRPQSRHDFFTQLPSFLGDVGADFTRGWSPWVVVAVTLGLAASLIASRRVARHRVPMLAAILGWSLALLIVNGRLPYVRVWMFLLPFALAAAAGGLTWSGERLARYGGAFARRATCLTIWAVVIAGAAVSLVQSDAVRRSDDTGTLHDGDAVAAFLVDRAQPRDRVIASAPSDLPLDFLLRARAVSSDLLRATPDSAQRLWVVVNDAAGQREAALVSAAEIVTGDFSAPVLARRFAGTSVYLRERTRPGCILDPTVCR